MGMSRTRNQPMEFRQQEVGYVMERWRASDSCSLVGVGSVGKSNLLQHLANPDVQAYYMRDVTGGKSFKAIIIDPSLLGPLPGASRMEYEPERCWAGYELMMHRLFLAFYPFNNLPPDDARVFFETYQTLQDGNNPLYAYMGLRYFELGLEIFMKQGIQIVLMFDEFEEMLKQLPVKFFLTLRGIRDANKKQLSYLTFTRSPLVDVVERLGIDALDIEPFTELFTDSVVYVGPYNDADSRNMLQELVRRNNKKYEGHVLEFLLWATGRYAGLMRSGFRSLELLGNLDADTVMKTNDKLANELALKRPVRMECKTIWMSLSDKERWMLREFASTRPNIDPNNLDIQQTFAVLQQKRLLKVQNNRVAIEPPVFASFVATNPDAEI